jgi:hypothetical protein
MKHEFKPIDFEKVKEQDHRSNLLISMKELERFYITLDKNIDRNNPVSQLMSAGIEIQLLTSKSADSHNCSLSLRAKEGIVIRREPILSNPVEITYDMLDFEIPQDIYKKPLVQRNAELRELYNQIDDLLNCLTLEIKKGHANGMRFKDHPLHHMQAIREEEKQELKVQRDKVLAECRKATDELRQQWIDAASPENTYFNEGLLKAMLNNVDKKTAKLIVNEAKQYSADKFGKDLPFAVYEYDEFKDCPEEKPSFLKA